MTKLSIIIPIFNRKENLQKVLASLDRQSMPAEEFDVVVSDDGSTDNPIEIIREYNNLLNIRYYWHQHRGVQISRARNEGAKLGMSEAYVFLDSDIMLNPAALEHYYNLFQSNPECVISGKYDWLPPMIFCKHDVYANWEKIIARKMPISRELKDLTGIIGDDPRTKNPFFFNSASPKSKYCLSMFGANNLFPKKLYWAIGGHDENIIGHGGEDADIAMGLQAAGHKCIFADEVIGYHIYHDRNQKRNVKEVLKNVKYIAKKHDLDKFEIRMGDIKKGELPLVYKKGAKDYV